MFDLDLYVLSLIFPWSNHIFYGFGGYMKFILTMLTAKQIFNIIYAHKHKRGK